MNEYCDKISIMYPHDTRVMGDYFPTECLIPSIDIWLEHPMSKKRIEKLVISALHLIEYLGYKSRSFPAYPLSIKKRNEYDSLVKYCKDYVDTIMSNFKHRVIPADLYPNELDFAKGNKKIVKLYKVIQDENFRVKFLLKIMKRNNLSITSDMGYDMVYDLFDCGIIFGSDFISDIEDIVYICLSRIFMKCRYNNTEIKFEKDLMLQNIINMIKRYYADGSNE